MPVISVIIPNYNHARYLAQRIDSILNQTFRDFELIILDDCSTDNSRTIIEDYVARFPAIRSYFNKANSGRPCTQWDFGVKKSEGEYIWICESDDFADPDFLETAAGILDKNRTVGLVYCDSYLLDEQTNRIIRTSGWKKHIDKHKWRQDYINSGRAELTDYLYLNNLINNVSAVLFRKDTYVEAGFADHQMKYSGDWFLYCRMLLISDIAFIARPLNTIRYHSGSSCHDYYTGDAYIKEVKRIYAFLNTQIRITCRKRLLMARNLAEMRARKLIRSIRRHSKSPS